MNRDVKTRQLVTFLAKEASRLISSGEFTERGAINAVMHTYRGDVLDQQKTLFGPVMAELRRILVEHDQVREARQAEAYDRMMRDAENQESEILSGFDGSDRPCEPYQEQPRIGMF